LIKFAAKSLKALMSACVTKVMKRLLQEEKVHAKVTLKQKYFP